MEEAEYYAVQLGQEKNKLRTYASLLYLIESQFFDFEKMEINPTKLLLAQGAVSDASQPLNYLSIAQGVERAMISRLSDTQDVYDVKQKELNEKRKSLRVLKIELEAEQKDLIAQQSAKENLLELTEGQEVRYQQMLKEAEEQEQQVANDINALQSDYLYYSQKLNQLSNTTQFNVYSNTVEYGDLDAINRLLGEKHQSLAWPVDPSRGITAYFRDESYKAYFGVPHNAIDLRAYQGTMIHAPADGVVYKVRDNGYGYSYLILAHRDNILTVYGHVLEFKVEEGDIVRQGDEIALSGGMPGTLGAGTMTTGPHLHFEVYNNGVHVDPLDYLPVLDLPAEYIPQKYLDQLGEVTADEINSAVEEEAAEAEEVSEEEESEEID
jgi:murein DD-endopeptidase MepM/ murein hydrolase activator NlpD